MKTLLKTIAISATAITLLANTAKADEIEPLQKEFARYYELGQFKKMFQTGHKLEKIIEAKLGAGHIKHIKALDRLANTYLMIGRKQISEKLLMKALKLSIEKHGEVSQTVLHTRASLGFIYMRQNRPGDAEKQFAKAIELSEKLNGPDHVETEVMRNNHAWLKQ